MKRPVIFHKGHPLAKTNGRLRESRFVLYEKLNGIAENCYWCNCILSWNTLCADHLNGNTEDNRPENIVPSCRGCNANRDDGTGYGRKKPKKCKECSKFFVSKSHHKKQVYCSIKCASLNRPERGTKTKHGTRSSYMYGCRCKKCKLSNINYWRSWYKKNKVNYLRSRHK